MPQNKMLSIAYLIFFQFYIFTFVLLINLFFETKSHRVYPMLDAEDAKYKRYTKRS